MVVFGGLQFIVCCILNKVQHGNLIARSFDEAVETASNYSAFYKFVEVIKWMTELALVIGVANGLVAPYPRAAQVGRKSGQCHCMATTMLLSSVPV
jgi:hypothetical protein